MTGLPPFLIELGATVNRLRKDMGDAEGVVAGGVRAMQSAADAARSALGGITAGLSIAGLAAWTKSAIDAADETAKMAQKIGVATADVAGLELAFEQAGLGGEDVQKVLARLSTQVADGSAALKALGVETHSTGGTLRSARDVLGDVADRFASMENGTRKTALAVELFGKQGADLIPLLNGGASGLAEMDELAQRLGLTIDTETAAAAERFNDTLSLLGKLTEGAARNLASDLLPTLNAIASAMLQYGADTTEAGRRTGWFGAAVATVLEALAVFGVNIAYVGRAVVGEVSTWWQQIKALVTEGPAGFKRIGQAWTAEAARMRAEVDATSSSIVNARRVQEIAALGAEQDEPKYRKLLDVHRESAVAVRAVGAGNEAAAREAERAAAEAKRQAAEVEKLTGSLRAKVRELEAERDAGEKLTPVQKLILETQAKLAEGTVKLTAAQRAEVDSLLARAQAAEQANAARAAEKKWLEETTKASEAYRSALGKKTEEIEREIEKQVAANAEMGRGKAATVELEIAKLADLRATALRNEAIERGIDGDAEAADQFRKQAEALGRLIELKERGIHVKAAREAADAWQKTTDSIEQGLTDSLFRAFERGGDFFSTFWEGIKNTFKTTVLKPVIQAVMAPVQAGIGSLVGTVLGGFSGAANAGDGGGGLLSGLSSLASLGSLFGSFGTAAGFGASALFGGTGLTALSSAGSMIGAGSLASGFGMAAGVIGPIALGLMALKALDKKSTPHVGGFVEALPDGTFRDITAAQGGTQNANLQGAVQGLIGSVVGTLNSLGATFGGLQGVSGTAVFSSDAGDPSWGQLRLRVGDWQVAMVDALGTLPAAAEEGFAEFGELSAGALRSALEFVDLPGWAREAFAALGDAASLDAVVQTATQVQQMQAALEGLRETLSPLGGVFSQLQTASSDAVFQLVQLSGGVEAFAQKAANYVANFFSADEQVSLAARQVQSALAAVGLDASSLTDRNSFRALVDSVQIDSELGPKQLAALLDVQDEFVRVADAIGRQGGSLGALATLAPGGALADSLIGQADTLQDVVDATTQTADATREAADRTVGVLEQVRDETVTTGAATLTGLERLEALLTELRDDVEEIRSTFTLAAAAPGGAT